VVSVQDLLESGDGVLQRDESSLDTSEDLGDGEGLRHEPVWRAENKSQSAELRVMTFRSITHLWIFRARSTVSLSSSDNSSIPKMAIMSCNDL
jgi:hypothetical protein